MNRAEQISHLQTLLARVQKRAKEPRTPRAAFVVSVAATPVAEPTASAAQEPAAVALAPAVPVVAPAPVTIVEVAASPTPPAVKPIEVVAEAAVAERAAEPVALDQASEATMVVDTTPATAPAQPSESVSVVELTPAPAVVEKVEPEVFEPTPVPTVVEKFEPVAVEKVEPVVEEKVEPTPAPAAVEKTEPQVVEKAAEPTPVPTVVEKVEPVVPTAAEPTPAPAPVEKPVETPVFAAPSEATVVETVAPAVVAAAQVGEEKAEPEAPKAEKADDVPELEFGELAEEEADRIGEAKEPTPLPTEVEERPPASSKRPTASAEQELADLQAEIEGLAAPPLTPPPESGPQEVPPVQISARQELEIDFSAKKIEPQEGATIEQLGQTVELEKPTEHLLELAPPAPPQELNVPAAKSEMEAELPGSVPPGLFTVELQKPAEPVPSQFSAEALTTPRPKLAEEAVTVPHMHVAGTLLQEPKPAQPLELVEELEQAPAKARAERAQDAQPTIEVRAAVTSTLQIAKSADAAAFVGAINTFKPQRFVELLDASIGLSVDS